MDGALEIFIGDLKKIRVGSYDKKLQVMADAWIFNGFNLLPGIIDYICELGYVVNYTDFDISNSSFICFNKNITPRSISFFKSSGMLTME